MTIKPKPSQKQVTMREKRFKTFEIKQFQTSTFYLNNQAQNQDKNVKSPSFIIIFYF